MRFVKLEASRSVIWHIWVGFEHYDCDMQRVDMHVPYYDTVRVVSSGTKVGIYSQTRLYKAGETTAEALVSVVRRYKVKR